MELNVTEIMENIPHRYPFLLVDKITELDVEGLKIVGIKNITMNEEFFQGHFPGYPVMPGVLQIEAMAQTGGVLLRKAMASDKKILPFFMSLDNVRFRSQVQPGDQLVMTVEITKLKSKLAKFKGVATVNGKVATEAEFMCMITEPKED
ncbi:MAG: 3-hydroxyacyl-ACP dehydratase FabZ [Kiritimatiellae bacterium]|jgi:3-hydroxyacyl-[acyl-carrier-protein] dehydratase|nr:3-hydroxyacyl-ACP dehydratase FabZ [Kiritimatiellia bacterium]